MKELTPKQEAYVRALVSGMSQREAYRSAYRAQEMLDRTVDKKAYMVFALGHVRARYDQLITEATAGCVYDRRRMIADLTEIVDTGLAHIRRTRGNDAHYDKLDRRDLADLPKGASAVLSAIDKLDRLLGLSAETAGGGEPVLIDDFADAP